LTAKQDNRARWPELAKVVDEMREVFGDVKVVAIYEKGELVIGTEDKHRTLVVPAADWQPTKKGRK
jgi:hypothetical protein